MVAGIEITAVLDGQRRGTLPDSLSFSDDLHRNFANFMPELDSFPESIQLPVLERFMPGRIHDKAMEMIGHPLDSKIGGGAKNCCQSEPANHTRKHLLWRHNVHRRKKLPAQLAARLDGSAVTIR
jgi:hypothetical protein